MFSFRILSLPSSCKTLLYKTGKPLTRKYSSSQSASRLQSLRQKLERGPSFADFLTNDSSQKFNVPNILNNDMTQDIDPQDELSPNVPLFYLPRDTSPPPSPVPKRVHIESYGCQMNFSDTEIVYAIMKKAGFETSPDPEEADVIFLNTCAIREKAEHKIWCRLSELKQKKKKRVDRPLVVGVLGCMAERLKEKLLEKEKMVDLVAGPDAYRDLPHLLHEVSTGHQAINVMLSADETYADIAPVRSGTDGVNAYVSIMRGCNNMCTYCIVPFTRGRERSRPAQTVENEVRELSRTGFREVVLLGQNVNSYNDISDTPGMGLVAPTPLVDGFTTLYRRPPVGVSFTELVERVSRVDPEMRIRFTSPHPKDFPDELLGLIRDRPNVCKHVHIPVQSGSSSTLERMRRGYTREAYLKLVRKIREIIPEVTLSSDFISGFCGETEEEHQETLSLLEEVKYDVAFMFAYSVREKTPAHRRLSDDVPVHVKKRRLQEVIDTFHRILFEKNLQEINKIHLVLTEGNSRKSHEQLKGRSDTNKKIIFPDIPVPIMEEGRRIREEVVRVKPGDYVVVQIERTSGLSLFGKPIAITTLEDFWRNRNIYKNGIL